MKYLELSLPDPESNLACDEALIEACEATDAAEGILRVWESQRYFAVLGHSNRFASEIDVAVCEAQGVAVLRRLSGGGTVLQGPGCVNYALVLRNGIDTPSTIGGSFQFVLEHHKRWIEEITGAQVEIAGGSDLAINGKKFSGNAQYRKRRFALLHGTFLARLDLAMVARCLKIPARQPLYRANRSHEGFLINLNIEARDLRRGLRETWQATDELLEVPWARIKELVKIRYSRTDWTGKF